MSTKPGITSAPDASISSRAAEDTLPTSSILPLRMPTSAVTPGVPRPSNTVPPRMTRSSILEFLPVQFPVQMPPEQREEAARHDMPDPPQTGHRDHCKFRRELRRNDAESET